MTISFTISFGTIFGSAQCASAIGMSMQILTEKCILNVDFMIMLPITWIKNTVENVDLIFLKITEQSYFIKIILTWCSECSQADIAVNFVNHSHAEKHTQIN